MIRPISDGNPVPNPSRRFDRLGFIGREFAIAGLAVCWTVYRLHVRDFIGVFLLGIVVAAVLTALNAWMSCR